MRSLLIPLLFAFPSLSFAQDLEIVNIRAGQGDATLIKGPLDGGNQFAILVDAGNIGGRDGGNILRAVLNKRGVERLDLLISTHYDADHIGGIVAVEPTEQAFCSVLTTHRVSLAMMTQMEMMADQLLPARSGYTLLGL